MELKFTLLREKKSNFKRSVHMYNFRYQLTLTCYEQAQKALNEKGPGRCEYIVADLGVSAHK
jgi:16S rRNA C1402 N4-methylase RsmH